LNWLDQDLQQNTRPCILAFWHHARYSSGDPLTGGHGDNPVVQPFWDRLTNAGADLILNGHEHNYERFKPMNTAGAEVTTGGGTREFVVGTGGTDNFYGFTNPVQANSANNFGNTTGVLRLNLNPTDSADPGYAWRFIPSPQRVQVNAVEVNTDSGSDTCN
jgi:hypothetical protein